MTASPIKLTPRLMTAVRYVRPGHLLCDVGTDHAYLPIWLCQTGVLTPVPLPDGVQSPAGHCVPSRPMYGTVPWNVRACTLPPPD